MEAAAAGKKGIENLECCNMPRNKRDGEDGNESLGSRGHHSPGDSIRRRSGSARSESLVSPFWPCLELLPLQLERVTQGLALGLGASLWRSFWDLIVLETGRASWGIKKMRFLGRDFVNFLLLLDASDRLVPSNQEAKSEFPVA